MNAAVEKPLLGAEGVGDSEEPVELAYRARPSGTPTGAVPGVSLPWQRVLAVGVLRLRELLVTRRRDLACLLILAISNLVLFGDLLLTIHGQLSWGNYLTPYTTSQIQPTQFLYEPNFLNGTVTLLSSGNLLNQAFEGVPLELLSAFLGLDAAVKAFAILTTISVSFSFYFLVRTWGVRPSAAVAASLFFSFNDFQIFLIGEGDFVQFVAESFLLLSLGFLALWVRRGGRPFWPIVVAFGCLALTTGEIQLTLLGGALFLLCGILLTLHQYRYSLRDSARSLGRFLLLSVALVPLFAYAILPLLSGNYLYSSGSPTALTLQGFAMRSEPFWQVLQLIPPVTLGQQSPALALAYSGVLGLWQGAAAILVVALLGSVLIVRDLRLLWIDLIVLTAAAFGAGPTGPAGGASSYLYLHFAPYASLNAPYYWQWVPISILYGVILGLVLDSVIGRWLRRSSREKPVAIGGLWVRRLRDPGARTVYAASLFGLICLAFLVAVAVLTPVVSNAAYGPWGTSVAGIRGTPLPADDQQIEPVLAQLAGSSGTGVAFFPGDVFAFPNGSNVPLNNPFTQWPSQRAPGLPFYAAPPLTSNYYFYWVYHLFYTNHTRYLAQLMGVEGISIFVVLYNLQSASFYPYFMPWAANVSASTLMQYQYGVTEAYSSKSFAVYRSNYLAPEAAYFSNRTIVAGSVATIDEMAYAGWNLTTEALSLSGDESVPGTSDPLAGAGSIVLGAQQGLYDLAFQEGGAFCVDPLSYVDTSVGAIGAWTTSQRPFLSTVGFDDPSPYAFASGTASVSIDLPGNGPSGAQLWVKLLRTPNTGTVQFSLNGESTPVLDTSSFPAPMTGMDYNGFIWTNTSSLPVGSGGVLSVDSTGGLNGIAEICVASPAQLTSGEASLFTDARSRAIGVSLVEAASDIANTSGSVVHEAAIARQNFSGVIPEGEYDLMTPSTAPASIAVQVPVNGQSGTVYVLVGSQSAGTLSVVVGGKATNLPPFVRTSNQLSSSTWQWYPASVRSVPGWATVKITAPKNTTAKLYVGAVAYVPDQDLTPAGLADLDRILAGGNENGGARLPSVPFTPPGGLPSIPVVDGSVSSHGIPVQPTISGFALGGGSCIAGSVLVRSSFFPSLEATGSATEVYSTFGSMNLVIEKGPGCVAGSSSKTWTYLLAGGAISFGTILLLALVPTYPRAYRATRSALRRLQPGTVDPPARTTSGPSEEAVAPIGTGDRDQALVDRFVTTAREMAMTISALPLDSEIRFEAALGLRDAIGLLAVHRHRDAVKRLSAVARTLAQGDSTPRR